MLRRPANDLRASIMTAHVGAPRGTPPCILFSWPARQITRYLRYLDIYGPCTVIYVELDGRNCHLHLTRWHLGAIYLDLR
jgi:hypothetical protein